MLDKIRAVFLLVILFTSYVVIQQHTVNDFEEQPMPSFTVVATEKPKAKKVKHEVELPGYPAPPDEPIYPAPGYPAPPTSDPFPTLRPPLPTAFPTQVPGTPTPFATPDMSYWCDLSPNAWFCAP